ncbi:MAG TPA: AAA family ATPase [Kofleriaceae bacterium]|nr:AAA family ATPase [Kofleriaceae bacterium]
MLGERLDYSNERQRHKRFVGRAALLERLDRALATDGWIVVTGGPGIGKSALLAAWLLRREAAGAAVPHHFIRRGGDLRGACASVSAAAILASSASGAAVRGASSARARTVARS